MMISMDWAMVVLTSTDVDLEQAVHAYSRSVCQAVPWLLKVFGAASTAFDNESVFFDHVALLSIHQSKCRLVNHGLQPIRPRARPFGPG